MITKIELGNNPHEWGNDYLEASSKRYGASGIMIIPLSSGRFAVANRAFELFYIIDDVGELPIPPAPSARHEARPRQGYDIPNLELDLDL